MGGREGEGGRRGREGHIKRGVERERGSNM